MRIWRVRFSCFYMFLVGRCVGLLPHNDPFCFIWWARGDWNTMRMSNLQAPVTHDFVLSPLTTPSSWGDDAPYKKHWFIETLDIYWILIKMRKTDTILRISIPPILFNSLVICVSADPGQARGWGLSHVRHQTQPHMWHAVLTRGLACDTGHGYLVY